MSGSGIDVGLGRDVLSRLVGYDIRDYPHRTPCNNGDNQMDKTPSDDTLFDVFYDGQFVGTKSYAQLLVDAESMREEAERYLLLTNDFGVRLHYGPPVAMQ